jgi:hypothetical protein
MAVGESYREYCMKSIKIQSKSCEMSRIVSISMDTVTLSLPARLTSDGCERNEYQLRAGKIQFNLSSPWTHPFHCRCTKARRGRTQTEDGTHWRLFSPRKRQFRPSCSSRLGQLLCRGERENGSVQWNIYLSVSSLAFASLNQVKQQLLLLVHALRHRRQIAITNGDDVIHHAILTFSREKI